MRPTVLMLALMAACGGGEEQAEKPQETAPVVQKATPKAPKLSFDEKLENARVAALARAETAVADSEALVAEDPTSDLAWLVLQGAAETSGQGRALYDRLDGAEAIGGRADRHHLLRSELALSAGMLAEAQSAARAAASQSPGASAAMLARAARAGAEVAPLAKGAEVDSARALIEFAVAKDARAARPFAEAAAAVAGWRAAALRGEVLAGRGDAAAAASEFAAAAADGDPRAVYVANIGRARLALAGSLPAGEDGVKPGAADAGVWMADATRAALSMGDGARAAAALDLAVGAMLRGLDPAGAQKLADEVRLALGDADGAGAASVGLTFARAALAAGDPAAALAAANAAAPGLGDKSADAHWVAAWAAHDLSDPDALGAAAEGLDGARQQLALAMQHAAAGRFVGARATLPQSGLSGRDAAYGAEAAARIDPSKAVPWLRKAVAAADKSGDRLLQVRTRLSLEAASRLAGDGSAAKVRADLARLVPQGAAGDGLRLELAARELIDGGKPEIAGTDVAAVAWSALASSSDPGAGVEGLAGVTAWASGRAAAVQGDAAAASRYSKAVGSLPLHRQGILSSGTALDGSLGVGVDVDLALLAGGKMDAATLGSGLAAHQVGHRLGALASDLSVGRVLTASLSDEDRVTLLNAAAGARAAMSIYQAGGGEFPADALATLAKAEAAAATAGSGFDALISKPAPTVAWLRESLNGSALISYRFALGQAHGIVITPRGGAIRSLGKLSSIERSISGHHSALMSAATSEVRASHRDGDRLRAALIDPFTDVLTGLGRYAVVGPAGLLRFPITTFPEQSSGLRWLADIRTVALLADLSEIEPLPVDTVEPPSFKPDFFGLGAPAPVDPEEAAPAAPEGDGEDGEAPEGEAAGGDAEEAAAAEEGTTTVSDEEMLRRHRATSEQPLDLAAAGRHFNGEFRDIRLGQRASIKAYRELAGTARYVHISRVPASADGGLELADGVLSIEDLRSINLVAEVVVISSVATPEQQIARARALREAGAGAVVIAGWEVQEAMLDRIFDGFYAALNRDRPPARALGEGRDTLLRDLLLGKDLDDPGVWGSLTLFDTP